jgi:hypothetical protein
MSSVRTPDGRDDLELCGRRWLNAGVYFLAFSLAGPVRSITARLASSGTEQSRPTVRLPAPRKTIRLRGGRLRVACHYADDPTGDGRAQVAVCGRLAQWTQPTCVVARFIVILFVAVAASSADPAIVGAQGVWSAAVALSPWGEMPNPPGIAVDGRGDEIVTWIDDAGHPMARSRTSNGGFGRPVVLGPATALRAAPRVAFDRSGNATVVWLARAGASAAANEVEASTEKGIRESR